MRVEGSGLRVEGSGLRVQLSNMDTVNFREGSGLRVEDLNLARCGRLFVGFLGGQVGVGLLQGLGSGFRIQASGFRVQGSGVRVQGSGFMGQVRIGGGRWAR